MRRFPLLLFVAAFSLLEKEVLGFASAPGVYPDDEKNAGNDMEMPRNPYQNGWTGYEFYYEKEPKKDVKSSKPSPMGFQDLQSSSSDRETPEDPQYFSAKGSESSGTSKPTATTTLAPKITKVPPSTTTQDQPTSTMSTERYQQEKSKRTTTTAPETGTDHLAPDNMDFNYGPQEMEDHTNKTSTTPITTTTTRSTTPTTSPTLTIITSHHQALAAQDPSPPKNLLTNIIEKKITRNRPGTDPNPGYGTGDSGYEQDLEYGKAPAPAPSPAPTTDDSGSHDSGYPMSGPSEESYDSGYANRTGSRGGHSPGQEPQLEKGTPHGTSSKGTLKDYSPSGSYEPAGPGQSLISNTGYGDPASQSPSDGTNLGSRPAVLGPRNPTDLYDVNRSANPMGYQHGPGQSTQPDSNGYDDSSSQSPSDSNLGSRPAVLGPRNPTVLYDDNRSMGHRHGPGQSPQTDSDGYDDPPSGLDQSPPSLGSDESASPGTPAGPSVQDLGQSPQTDSNGLTDHGSVGSSGPVSFARHGSNHNIGPNHGPANPEVYGPGNNESSDEDITMDHRGPGGLGSSKSSGPVSPAKSARGLNQGHPSKNGPASPHAYRPGNYLNSDEDITIQGLGSSSKFRHENWPPGSHPTLAPRSPSPHSPPHQSPANDNDEFEEEHDEGYGSPTDDVAANYIDRTSPLSTHHMVKAQISEIDRIAESFENSAREPVEYEQKITRESSKGINAIQKNLGRKARKCCSCCDEKQPVSRNIETKFVQQAVSPSHHLGEAAPVDGFQQNTIGGSAYIQPQAPAQQPPQTVYQQPFQQYQPQYPQSYPYQQPSSGCGCPAPPQNCCPPPQPCCMPTIPCCPPIPCCPQPKICCQPTPVCLPPPTCCSINFQLPTIPICGRACPSCPCRRRVHRARRLKRHSINSNCHQCSTAGEPWKAMIHHREKRAAPGCSSGFSTMSQNSCSTCGASNLRSPRVKRMGCLPCLGRKKRETDHVRVKRMGCLPCLGGGRKKRSLSSGCSQCNSLGHLFNRYKRSLFGCSPCAPQPSCGCQGRKKRSVMVRVVKRAPETCDATCCDYSRCLNRQKKESLVPF